jgi:hypothetical protein
LARRLAREDEKASVERPLLNDYHCCSIVQ